MTLIAHKPLHTEKKQPSSLYAVNRAKEKYAPVHTNSKGASAGVEESVEVIEMGAGLDGTRLQVRKVGSTPQSDHTVPHPALGAPSILHPTTSSTTPSPPVTTTTPTTTPTTTTTTTTTTTSTTTTSPTTTLPERYCKIKRPWDAKSRIIEEHTSIRLYKDGDKDCSELCFCEVHERTKCPGLHREPPCETDFAVYTTTPPPTKPSEGSASATPGTSSA
nr:integumentary mucin C.1-like [Penaeus vannamei]